MDAKVHIHIRLSPTVLDHFRAGGPGWQTRIDEILRKCAHSDEVGRGFRAKAAARTD